MGRKTGKPTPRYAKGVFDIVTPYSGNGSSQFGISCKMKGALNKARKATAPAKTDGRAYIELSNSARAFSAAFAEAGITTDNFMLEENPTRTGEAILGTVNSWHSVAAENGVELSKSCYLVLLYEPKSMLFKLMQFPITLPSAESLTWYAGMGRSGGIGKHIKGATADGIVFEYYGGSGGQLKYYPKVSDAIYVSPEFELEEITTDVSGLLLRKAEDYFEAKWEAARDD